MRLPAIVFLTIVACAAEAPSLPDWESYKQRATRVFEGETSYVTGGDMPVTLDELRRGYLAQVEGEALRQAGIAVEESHSTVNRIGTYLNIDDIWKWSDAHSLTYCISDTFGPLKNRVIGEMKTATTAWEKYAEVDFIYLPAHDANCKNSNKGVVFSVRPWNDDGACAFFPSGGACVPRTLVINIPIIDQQYAPVTTQGVFEHELGHILGLRHEHTRDMDSFCYEDDHWRTLTPYDGKSIMHYPWCPGGTNDGDLFITRYDAIGISQLYP
jgi:Metallo-peptidase family M12